jgi:hypothetical protein
MCCVPMNPEDSPLAVSSSSNLRSSYTLWHRNSRVSVCKLARLELASGTCGLSAHALRALLPCCQQLTYVAGAPPQDSAAPATGLLPKLQTLKLAFTNRPHHRPNLQSENLVQWLAAAPPLSHLRLSRACIARACIPASLFSRLQAHVWASLDLASLELLTDEHCRVITSPTSQTRLRVTTGTSLISTSTSGSSPGSAHSCVARRCRPARPFGSFQSARSLT